MSSFGSFVFGAIAGGGLVYGSLTYHLLNTSEGLLLVPKLSATFSQTYVDIRGFTATDWANNRGLAAAVIRAGKENLLADAAVDTLRQSVHRFLGDAGLQPQPAPSGS